MDIMYYMISLKISDVQYIPQEYIFTKQF